MSVMVFLGIAALLAYCDWRHRAVPRIVCIGGATLGAFLMPSSWCVVSITLGAVIAFLADLPSGDMMVGAMLGPWLGIEGTLLAWILALLVGNGIWVLWEYRLIDWPGEWPFTPLLLIPACVIVVTQGGG